MSERKDSKTEPKPISVRESVDPKDLSLNHQSPLLIPEAPKLVKRRPKKPAPKPKD